MVCDLTQVRCNCQQMLPKDKEEFQTILGINNYLSKFCPSTTDVCESLRKMTSARTVWTWNATYQKIFNKAKSTIKEDACMKFYDQTKPLYIETDIPGFGLGAALLQTGSGTSCPRVEAPEKQHSQTNNICKQEPVKCRKKHAAT